MGDFWQEWWEKRKEDLLNSIPFEQECTKRGLVSSAFQCVKCGLVTDADWGVLNQAYEGLQKWVHAGLMPALAFHVDGEFGSEAILLKAIAEKKYVSVRKTNSLGRAYCLGFEEALPSMWEKGYVVVVEGVFDWIPLKQFMTVGVSSLTDTVSPSQAVMLARYVRVVGLMFDNDEAGRKGQRKSKYRLEKEGVIVLEAKPGRHHDPGDWYKNDTEGFERMVQEFEEDLKYAVEMSV